ncbi:hypothetical protein KIN20_014183 [Parelaphostrongylus tenuis]|uniref:Uncharacterized protein n=1 Tax=Parelaphostrongylus tenuis TaxID=148309 RepID=A0AAD5QRN2_PARTN|nr:hypothetical protein KIN20_014183 [Parelaphostrongylus tenuis]
MPLDTSACERFLSVPDHIKFYVIAPTRTEEREDRHKTVIRRAKFSVRKCRRRRLCRSQHTRLSSAISYEAPSTFLVSFAYPTFTRQEQASTMKSPSTNSFSDILMSNEERQAKVNTSRKIQRNGRERKRERIPSCRTSIHGASLNGNSYFDKRESRRRTRKVSLWHNSCVRSINTYQGEKVPLVTP